MAIKFRYDAAAVVPPSNESTRKYGQSLVLQQQQQKNQNQQAGYDRLFRAGSQLQQQNFQFNREKAQNEFQTQRDKTQFDQRQQEQRAADFAAARDRIDNYAKDTLNNPDLPQNLRQQIQNLLSGKMTVLAGGFDAPAQQQFLDQYNAQLAAILSEIPPKAPPPTPDEELRGAIQMFDGVPFQKDKDGVWQRVDLGEGQGGGSGSGSGRGGGQQQPSRPTSLDDLIATDPRARAELRAYEEQELKSLLDGGPVTPEILNKAREQARKAFERDLGLGTPTLAPEITNPPLPNYGNSSAAYYNPPANALPPAQPTPGTEQSILETDAPAGIPITPPDPGQPPSPAMPPAGGPPAPGQPGNTLTEDERNQRIIDAGYEQRIDSNGDPFWYKTPAAPTAPQDGRMPPTQPPPQTEVPPVAGTDTAQPSGQRSPLYSTGMSDLLNRLTNPDGSKREQPKSTGKKDKDGYLIMDDGSKIDPRDAYAVKSGGTMSDLLNRMTNPDGTQKKSDSGISDLLYREKPRPEWTGETDKRGYYIMDDGSKVDPRDTYALRKNGNDDLFRATNPDGTPKLPAPGMPAETPSQWQQTWDALQKAQQGWDNAYKSAGQSQNPQAGQSQSPPSDRVASLARTDGRTTYLNPDGSTSLGPMPDASTKVDPKLLLESNAGGKQGQDSITIQSAQAAAQQYEVAAQGLQSLQAEVDTIEKQIRATAAQRGGGKYKSTKLDQLKKEQKRLKDITQQHQKAMEQADKTVRGYRDQEIAKQPAAQKLSKAGKRPQDFAEAEFQLQNLRRQYPDMGSMPADAKKRLKEAMAVIQAGR